MQFDNVHFLRDNPNVPSDLEQMPNLLNFMKDNGTLLTNDHTDPDLPHGRWDPELADGPLPEPARPGRLELVRLLQAGRLGRVLVELQVLDRHDRRRQPGNGPPTPAGDPNYNMVNNDPASLGGTGAVRNAPAPWVPFTRAGCDVGNVGIANAVLENNNAIVFRERSRPPSRRRAAAGATNIKVASVDRASPPARRSRSTPGRTLENAVDRHGRHRQARPAPASR